MAFKRRRIQGGRPYVKRGRFGVFSRGPHRYGSKFRKKKRNYALRFRGRSKKSYRKTSRLAANLSLIGETKYRGRNRDCLVPSVKPGINPSTHEAGALTFVHLNSGEPLNAINFPDFQVADTQLNMFEFPAGGDTGQHRDGEWLFIKKAHFKLRIQMQPLGSLPLQYPSDLTEDQLHDLMNPQQEFRVIVVKANRKYNKIGQFPNVQTELFINTENDKFGTANPDANYNLYFNALINKTKFMVLKDKRFTLSPPSVAFLPNQAANPYATGAFTLEPQKGRHHKIITYNQNVNLKAHYDGDTPDSFDTQLLTIIMAAPTTWCTINKTNTNFNWDVSVLATTTALDA